MTDKLKCPFCGAELTINLRPFDGCVKARCVNADCRYAEWTFPLEIWQLIIDSKKAQDALKVATEKLTDIELIVVRNGVFSGFEKMRIKQDVKDAINEILSITK